MKTVLDWFLADLVQTEMEVSGELYQAMVENAIQYLKIGRLSWKEWSMLGEASRKAFVEAADSLHVQSVLEKK